MGSDVKKLKKITYELDDFILEKYEAEIGPIRDQISKYNDETLNLLKKALHEKMFPPEINTWFIKEAKESDFDEQKFLKKYLCLLM